MSGIVELNRSGVSHVTGAFYVRVCERAKEREEGVRVRTQSFYLLSTIISQAFRPDLFIVLSSLFV